MIMARHKRHNPERRAWKGRSYKAAGKRIQDLKIQDPDLLQLDSYRIVHPELELEEPPPSEPFPF